MTFTFEIQLITCSFNYFCYSKFFLIYFCNFFSNNFFIIKIDNNICSQHSIFTFFIHKNFFRPIPFAKMFLYFDILTWSTTLKLESSLLFFLLKSITLDVTSTCFVLVVLRYVLLYLLAISSNLSIYAFLDIGVKFL